MSRRDSDPLSQPVALTDAEWSVIKVVWRQGRCTAGAVQAELAGERGWAYSTVKTTMDRMVRKGILALERAGNVQWFEARVSRGQVARSEVRRLLERAFDGAVAPMVNHLVTHEKLSPEDVAALRRMIDDAAPEETEE